MYENLKMNLEKWPRLYLELLRIRRYGDWSKSWVVSKNTDCVIDGFPRSANSFAYAAFAGSQNVERPLRIATHTHSPAQIIQAVRWDIPTMVCVRNPKDAVRGLLAFRLEIGLREGASLAQISWPKRGEIEDAVRRWCFFHNQILPYRNSFFVAPFERITSDYTNLSREFVNWSGREWQPWEPELVSAEDIKGEAYHVGPTSLREELKERINSAVDRAGVEHLLKESVNLYYGLVRYP